MDLVLYVSLLAGIVLGRLLGRQPRAVAALGDLVLFLLVLSVGAVTGEHAAGLAGEAGGLVLRIGALLGASIAAGMIVGFLVVGGRR